MRDVVVAFVDRSHVETSENLKNLLGYGGLTGSNAATDWLAHLLEGGVDGRRTVQPHRRVDDSQPRPDLCLRTESRDWRAGLRQTNRAKPGATRIPAAGHARRYEPAHAVL